MIRYSRLEPDWQVDFWILSLDHNVYSSILTLQLFLYVATNSYEFFQEKYPVIVKFQVINMESLSKISSSQTMKINIYQIDIILHPRNIEPRIPS